MLTLKEIKNHVHLHKKVSPWALKMCSQHNSNCLKANLPYAIETVITVREHGEEYIVTVVMRQSMTFIYL